MRSSAPISGRGTVASVSRTVKSLDSMAEPVYTPKVTLLKPALCAKEAHHDKRNHGHHHGRSAQRPLSRRGRRIERQRERLRVLRAGELQDAGAAQPRWV